MPCLILTGGPCVGKTTFASKLRERALQHKKSDIRKVVIINEESACSDWTKADCYATSQAEKKTRGALKAEFDLEVSRISGPETLVVLDSMNYIKGYRYELHCISKASGERHGVIWVLNNAEAAKKWNKATSSGQENRYTDKLMDELVLRYEPPDERNRWDKPLYRIDMTPTQHGSEAGSKAANVTAAQDTLQRSVYNMHALSDSLNTDTDAAILSSNNNNNQKKSASSTFKRAGFTRATKQQQQHTEQQSPVVDESNHIGVAANKPTTEVKTGDERRVPVISLEERIDEILDSFLLNVEPLKEGLSTRQHVTAEANVLHEVDSITHQVCHSIMSGQKMVGVKGTTVSVPVVGENDAVKLNLKRTVSLAELKRLRRQYIRWVANHPPEDSTQRGITVSFVAYLEAQM